MTDITAHTLQIDSCLVHYLSAGDPGGRTIILLHGMKFQAATWQGLGTLDTLAAAGFHAIAIDMPGFGKSQACSLEQDTVLEKFINATCNQKVVLAGPSMGGRIALEFTLNHPALVNGLLLIGAVGVEENRDKLSSISIPTLIIWGGEDKVSPMKNCNLLYSSINNSKKIIIDGAPHPCYLDNPDLWHAELINYLNNLND